MLRRAPDLSGEPRAPSFSPSRALACGAVWLAWVGCVGTRRSGPSLTFRPAPLLCRPQPFVKENIKKNYGDSFTSVFGKKTGATMISAVSGSIMGVGEIALLPLDVLKIKAQTNPESLAGKGVVSIFQQEGFALYRGWGWTAARNAPGSFSLFGGAALAKQLMGVTEGKATFAQDTVASVAGSVASITVAAPLDVIKTRLQSGQAGSKSGFTVIGDLVKEEGMSAFFKGLTPKIIVVGPKLIFSFTIAQQLMQYFEKVL